ncbi:MAG: DUF4340 domain-containing protein [Verrucomicrobiota bacterium]
MNSKSTWIWIGIAAVLFAVIFWVEKFGPKPPPGPAPLLPDFQAALVTSVQLGLGDQLEIQAVRTNGNWQLIKPISYPAQAASIETLLLVLQRLGPAVVISGAEVRQRKNADQEFGFAKPQATLTLKSRDEVRPILIGSRTANGDQVYVQVVGTEGVFVVDADLLKMLPRKADDWRDTALADLGRILFDRIAVSNTVATLGLQRDPSNHLWRLTRPMSARADSERVNLALQKLNAARVTRFVTDDPKADLEPFGLNPPDLELALAQESNAVAVFQFGRSPTNDSTQVYARRLGFNTIVTVPNEFLELWRTPLNLFRDPRVVTFTRPLDQIEFTGGEPFTVQHTPSNSWRMVQSPLPVDAGLVGELITTLGNLTVEQFKDSITDADLPRYGLAEPIRQVVVSSSVTNGVGLTNLILAAISFGTTNGEFYARRADENPVYAIRAADYLKLPTAPWQLRERRIWNFAASNVVRLVIEERGQKRELRRGGTNSWELAAGSQGVFSPTFVEKAVNLFGDEMVATAWVARGADSLEHYGFPTNHSSLTFELKDGAKYAVVFGGMSPAQYCYAAVTLEGEPWVFELPMALHQYRLFALSFLPQPP